VVRLRREGEVLGLLVLQLSGQLVDFLVLLLLCGVVILKVSAGLLDAIVEVSSLVATSAEVSLAPLDFDFALVEHCFRVHDIAVDGVALLAEVCVDLLEILKVVLEQSDVMGLSVDLFFIICL